MIIIENVRLLVLRINFAADAHVARAEITVGHVRRQRRRTFIYGAATPRAILSMCCDNHPLFSQWMPSLFPRPKSVLICLICGQALLSLLSVPALSRGKGSFQDRL